MRLYHVTREKNVLSILSKGFVVGSSRSRYSEGPFGSAAYDPEGIWFFARRKDATDFVKGERGWALVTVDIPTYMVNVWDIGGANENWRFVKS